MRISKLQRIGTPIFTLRSLAGSKRACYYVSYDSEQLCGIAIFHEDDNHCTLAMVRDENGERVTMGSFTPSHFVEPDDLAEMVRLYNMTLGTSSVTLISPAI
ncbi:hypothetical protein [Sphingobacterium griseoflavum]|uniref:Uncharacterized protein n=1 Tax=Sphingobacterium griseoflavum TaxID=1474952 RepID=A0ABQ3HWG1_9SPHI|nr:hypothetical protein [Sphingobacterium griseoflavum]GHE31179.1 hypothetical protein GCM10017764_12830 [Sphingobacterium griseoflavum]